MAHTRALVFWNNLQGKGNFAAVGCVSEHARVIPCVIEESRPEPKGVLLLTDAVIRETKVNGFLQISVLPNPVPDQG